jgi:dTDP-4-dehydrorhamnose 3,5-epimerase
MGEISIDDILITLLKRIPVSGGDVLHAMKKTDIGFDEFGEAYFSKVDYGAVKAWKKHNRMTLNLIVPYGEVRFVFFDTKGKFREITIGESFYARITVPPGLWFGFQGVSKGGSLLLNIANIEHNPTEIERKEQNELNYNWNNN